MAGEDEEDEDEESEYSDSDEDDEDEGDADPTVIKARRITPVPLETTAPPRPRAPVDQLVPAGSSELKLHVRVAGTDEEEIQDAFSASCPGVQSSSQPSDDPSAPFVDPFVGPTAINKFSGYGQPTGRQPVGWKGVFEVARQQMAKAVAAKRRKKEKPVVFADKGFSPADLEMGVIGTCYFISSLASLTNREHLFRHAVRADALADAKRNAYRFHFYRFGAWRTVTVDDKVPVDPEDRISYATSTGREEVWISLAEKAYAKLNGSYFDIDGGEEHLAMSDMGEGHVEQLYFPGSRRAAKSRSALDWDAIVKACKEGAMVGVATEAKAGAAAAAGGVGETDNGQGIVGGHAYSVLEVLIYADEDGEEHRLLLMLNPWADTEWSGPWSDSDDARWTVEAQKQLNHKAKEVKKGKDGKPLLDKDGNPVVKVKDDGFFFMEWSDVQRIFASVSLFYSHVGWKSHQFRGNLPAAGSAQRKLRFDADPSDASPVHIVVHRLAPKSEADGKEVIINTEIVVTDAEDNSEVIRVVGDDYVTSLRMETKPGKHYNVAVNNKDNFEAPACIEIVAKSHAVTAAESK